MRKIFPAAAAALLVMFCGSAWADRIPSFSAFPTWGLCTGDYVRMREEPDTESEIRGRLNTDDRVVVLGQTSVNGQTWYEVEHPTDEGSAWVFGKYIHAAYEEEYQEDPMRQLLVKLNITFGATPDKARALFGKPTKQKREVIGSEGDIVRINMTWSGHDAEYLNGHLTGVNVTKGKTPFGNIRIGNKVDKLEDELGKPKDSSDESWTYQAGEMDYITFTIEDGKITEMNYQYYYDIG